jgi:predicted transcriptional regulator
MQHLAIMKKSWKLIDKILSGEKVIETRWYKNRSAPWGRIKKGEIIYFKDSGEPVTARATVSKIEQFEFANDHESLDLYRKYSTEDLGTGEVSEEVRTYVEGKRYAIIIYLENPQVIKPFEIDKTGYGISSAWICVDNIDDIRK